MGTVGTRITVDHDTWLIMREFPQHPKAVVSRVTDTAGEERFLVLTWMPDPAERRMVGIFRSLSEADAAVPWPSRETPPLHYAPSDEARAKQREENRRATERAEQLSGRPPRG